MHNSITWKNILFFNMGIIVERTPTITKAKRRIKQYTIPGRSGVLNIDEKTYEPFNLTLECHYKDDNVNKDEINSWLDGYGKLSLDGEREYTGIVSNAIPYEKVQDFKRFQVQFMLNPIAKKIVATTEEIDTLQSSVSINVGGNTDTYPTITIGVSGDASVVINNQSFALVDADGEYVLDCEAKEILKNGTNASNKMTGIFPYLSPGENQIDMIGTITSMTISYNESYL